MEKKVSFLQGEFAKTVYDGYMEGEQMELAHKHLEGFFRQDYLVHWTICALLGTEPHPVVDKALRETLIPYFGVVCDLCQRNMLIAQGCVEHGYQDQKGRKMMAIRSAQDDQCHDCGCRPGEFHHPGCDMERCPKCGDQLISCGCELSLES